MSPPSDDWTPSPELLAAYFDGELDPPGTAALRRRLEAWLEDHPEAREVLGDYRRLARLWHDTAPADPGADAWRRVRAGLDAAPPGGTLPGSPVGRWLAPLLATAAAVGLLAWFGWSAINPPQEPAGVLVKLPPPPVVDEEPLPVATENEVVILRVEGADTGTLVVGELPVRGVLELAAPGEVALDTVRPDARDNMVPHVGFDGPHRPMVWARLETEQMEP